MQVKVWNDNVYPYSEVFKGSKIQIPAGSYITMDFEEAVEFKSAFSPIELDGDDMPKPSSYKMIRIDQSGAGEVVASKADLVCHATGKVATSSAELEKAIDDHAHMMVDAKEIEKRRPGRPKTDEQGN